MRKLRVIFLMLILGLFTIAWPACDKAGLGIPQTTVTKGTIATLPVHLGNGKPCPGLQFEVVIPNKYLQFVSCQTTAKTEGWFVQCNEPTATPGRVIVILYNMEQKVLAPGETSPVVDLKYKVDDDAVSGECIDVTIQNTVVANEAHERMEIVGELGRQVCIK